MTRKYDWLIALSLFVAGLLLVHWASGMAEIEKPTAEAMGREK